MARVGLALLTVLLALGGAGCSGNQQCTTPSCMTNKDPPQVFLIAPETNQVGTGLKVKANVVGCAAITQIQILNNTTFLLAIDAPTKVPVDIVIPPAAFNTLYQTLGIAAKLTLVAKGVCDDGRSNKSTPVGVNFFPVASVTPPAEGNGSALPDIFVAEGGVGGVPTTFVGCVGTANGVGLARFDTSGNAINANLNLPFPCSYNASISEKNNASGFRWLLEPGVGVFSFDSTNPSTPLNIEGYRTGAFTQIAIGPDGDAVVWVTNQVSGSPSLLRLSKSGGAEEAELWGAQTDGLMAGPPVISQNVVYTIGWNGVLLSGTGTMKVQKYNYATGAFIGESPITNTTYGDLDQPRIPPSTFSTDGQLVYFAFQNTGGTKDTSGVVACATNGTTGCGPSIGSKWITELIDDVIVAAVPFSGGAMIAGIGSQKTYFFSASDGHLVNAYDLPIAADGALVVKAVQPGNGTDFYIMNGPDSLGYPTEIIAVDNPINGELWRVEINGGDVPSSAVTLAIDEANTTWLRLGQNQVLPLTLNQYRAVKGANLPPK